VTYNKVVKGVFVNRPNRFIAVVDIAGKREHVHVKNTGRCKELLLPGSDVVLFASDNPGRKTKYDLIAVYKKRRNLPPLLINMDSQVPNDAVAEWLKECGMFSECAQIRREVTYNSSRFDFYIEDGEKRAFLEVKGVTLESDGTAMFPDAPTERGVKHINELVNCVSEGYMGLILFVIQMKGVNTFTTNDITHKAFGTALRNAVEHGVKVIAYDCDVTPDSIRLSSEIPVEL